MPSRPPAAPRAPAPRVPEAADRPAGADVDASGIPVLRSEDILRGRRAVEILHAGVRYRLSVTSTGKLILTK